jgi:hypothetical protein
MMVTVAVNKAKVAGAIMGNSECSDKSTDVCEDCGFAVLEGKAGCLKIFEATIAKEFSDYRYGRIHRLTVDAYSLQHPEKYMRSGKSFAAHLTGMCAALGEQDVQGIQDVNRAVQKWLSTNPHLEKPARLPDQRGTLTIAHIRDATDGDDHMKRVREWAQAVWVAWSEHHDLARRLIHDAVSHNSES